jgi:NAD-dependent dihydropyrimidine dehydrogenase PreA subunit
MKRNIVRIDRDKCNGCGKCVTACHEGAIRLVDGKAELVSEIYCDGLGACLGDCPTGAITVEVREAAAFDEAAVAERQRQLKAKAAAPPTGGCPGARAFSFSGKTACARPSVAPVAGAAGPGQLTQWPVQLRLVPVNAPWWEQADILLAADCVAVAVPDFQQRLLKGRKVAVMCPKLDDLDGYVEKLAAILAENNVRSLTVARMHVPCCGGIVRIAQEAMQRSGKTIPVQVQVFDHTGVQQG